MFSSYFCTSQKCYQGSDIIFGMSCFISSKSSSLVFVFKLLFCKGDIVIVFFGVCVFLFYLVGQVMSYRPNSQLIIYQSSAIVQI